MARKLRIPSHGAIHHVMNRGDRREASFVDDADRRQLLVALTEASAQTSWRAHAFCLMPKRFHLVLETPRPHLIRRHRAAAARAERLRLAGLARLGWNEQDLRTRRKGQPGEVAPALELRGQTTLPLAWIAQRLHMGTRGHLALLLQRRKQRKTGYHNIIN